MFIQKTFHVHQGLEIAKQRVTNLHSFRRELTSFSQAMVNADGTGRFEFVTTNGFQARIEMEELASAETDQILFRSTGGNVDVVGLLEFAAIRENLTEVQITLDYALKSALHSLLDALTDSMERFIERQLRIVVAHLEGVRPMPVAYDFRAPAGFASTPHFAH